MIKKSRLNNKNLSRSTNLAFNLDTKFRQCEKIFLIAQKDLNLPVQLMDELELELNLSDSNEEHNSMFNKKRFRRDCDSIQQNDDSLLDDMINSQGIVSVNKNDFEIMKENAKINEQLMLEAFIQERKEKEKLELREYFQSDTKEMITTLGTSDDINNNNDIMYFGDDGTATSATASSGGFDYFLECAKEKCQPKGALEWK